MTYLEFINLLVRLGPKLSQVWPLVLSIIADLRSIQSIISGTERQLMAAAPAEVSGDELLAESDFVDTLSRDATMMMSARAADGHRLREIWQFVQANPALLKILIGLLAL